MADRPVRRLSSHGNQTGMTLMEELVAIAIVAIAVFPMASIRTSSGMSCQF